MHLFLATSLCGLILFLFSESFFGLKTCLELFLLVWLRFNVADVLLPFLTFVRVFCFFRSPVFDDEFVSLFQAINSQDLAFNDDVSETVLVLLIESLLDLGLIIEHFVLNFVFLLDSFLIEFTLFPILWVFLLLSLLLFLLLSFHFVLFHLFSDFFTLFLLGCPKILFAFLFSLDIQLVVLVGFVDRLFQKVLVEMGSSRFIVGIQVISPTWRSAEAQLLLSAGRISIVIIF